MKSLDHPNIAHCLGWFEAERDIWIEQELYHGDLNSFIEKFKGSHVPEQEVLKMLWQISVALQHTHARGIIHRDIKPENVLVTHDGYLKLSDFGLAKDTNKGKSKFTIGYGTQGYQAPEIISGEPIYSEACDIWSLACLGYDACFVNSEKWGF